MPIFSLIRRGLSRLNPIERAVKKGLEPYHGYTKAGHAVHAKVSDYHKADTVYARFNKRIALWLVNHIGTMTCFWLFTVLSLLSLPATLHLMGLIPLHCIIPAFFLSFGFIYLITWICQNYIQLVLLPGLMVGQNLQNEANDARSAKQFEDTEDILKEQRAQHRILELIAKKVGADIEQVIS